MNKCNLYWVAKSGKVKRACIRWNALREKKKYIYGKLRAVATGLNMITLGLLQWMEECKWHPI